jgi:hypothetical protein
MTISPIRLRAHVLFGTAAVLGACGLAAITALSASAVTTTKITSVAFGGSATAPTLTIRGSGFGSEPSASPSGPPYHYLPGCTSQAPIGNKNDGHDYGAQALWVGWNHVQAGAYVKGAGGYLDCVGLIIKKYSTTEIVVTPGCQYPYYAKLTNGTSVTVTVSDHRFTTKVSYS